MTIEVSVAPVKKNLPAPKKEQPKKDQKKFIHPLPERKPLTPEQKARRDAWLKRKAEIEQKRLAEKVEATRVGSLRTQYWSDDQIRALSGQDLINAYKSAVASATLLGATTDHRGNSTCADVVAIKKVIIKRAKKNKWDGTGDPVEFYAKVLSDKAARNAVS